MQCPLADEQESISACDGAQEKQPEQKLRLLEDSRSNDLQHGEIAFQFVFVHVRTVAVPLDAFVLNELVKDVIP